MSHSLTAPVHEAVKMYCELGENRMVDNGLSSPNCEPRLLNVCHGEHAPLSTLTWWKERGKGTHFEFGKQLLPHIDDFRQWQPDFYPLSRYP
jgi:hypothetical protein